MLIVKSWALFKYLGNSVNKDWDKGSETRPALMSNLLNRKTP